MSPRSPSDLTFLARTNFRNDRRLFGVRRDDRRHHLYLVGKTGTGKSTLLEFLMRQDLARGEGFALLDPHGDLAGKVRNAVPEERQQGVLYWDVPDPACNIGFNPLERIPPDKRPLAASGLLDTFKKLWEDSWGPRLEHLLRHSLLVLLDQPEATLADVQQLLLDQEYRKRAALRSANAQVRDFWLREFEAWPVRFRAEAIAPLQNKVGAFLAHPVLQRVLTAPRSSFELRRVMDQGGILLVNLAKGRLGEDASALLGSLLLSSIGFAALTRADLPEPERRDFYVHLDEFHHFTTASLASMLAELRKYGVSLTLAHQHLAQLDPAVREAILGNVGTLVAFRVGATDAELLEREFAPELEVLDLVNLPNYSVYVRLMVNGAVQRPFSGETVQPCDE